MTREETKKKRSKRKQSESSGLFQNGVHIIGGKKTPRPKPKKGKRDWKFEDDD